jgi:hypothetical protein
MASSDARTRPGADPLKGRFGVVPRFVEFTSDDSHVWWRPLDVDQFLADLRSREARIALSALRSYSNAVLTVVVADTDGLPTSEGNSAMYKGREEV